MSKTHRYDPNKSRHTRSFDARQTDHDRRLRRQAKELIREANGDFMSALGLDDTGRPLKRRHC